MRKAVNVLVGYLFGLLLCSLLLKYFGIENYVNPLNDSRTQLLNPMMIITVAGGILSLWLTLPRKTFYIFFGHLCWAVGLPLSCTISCR